MGPHASYNGKEKKNTSAKNKVQDSIKARTSLVIQCLRIYLPVQRSSGLIPDQGTRSPHAIEQLSLGAMATEPLHSRAYKL